MIILNLLGGLAVAVPGQVKGLYYAWQQYGVLQWADLVAPAAAIASEGFIVTKAIASAINAVSGDLVHYHGLRYCTLSQPHYNNIGL